MVLTVTGVSFIDLFCRTTEGFPTDIVVRATGKAASNLRSDSSVVGRPTRAEFCSRRFKTRRETRVVDSLETQSALR